MQNTKRFWQRKFEASSCVCVCGGGGSAKYKLLGCEFPYLSSVWRTVETKLPPLCLFNQKLEWIISPLKVKPGKWLHLYKPYILLAFLRSPHLARTLGSPGGPFYHLVHGAVLSQMFGPSCQVYYKDTDVSWKWQKDQRDCLCLMCWNKAEFC